MVEQQGNQAAGPDVRRRRRPGDLAYHFTRQYGAQLHSLIIGRYSRTNEMVLHALTKLYMPGNKVAGAGMTKHAAAVHAQIVQRLRYPMLMVLNFVNTRLVAKWGSERLFRYGAWAAASALWLALDAWWGLGAVAGLAIPIFCYMSVSGFIVANSVASALALFPKQAGAASSLVGAMHYGSGVFSAALLGWCTDGPPWTMGWIVAVGGVGCLVFALWRRTEPEVSCEPMSQPEPVR